MLKALMKKQFLELNVYYFQNMKTGKNRGRGGTILLVAAFIFVFVFIAIAFMQVAKMFADAFVGTGLDWLYFSIMSLIAVFMGVLGSVFNTYAHLYRAKDNELLLAMPIPPSKILFVRMVGVFAMGLLYESLIFIPSVIRYWMKVPPGIVSIIFPVLLMILLGFIIMALTCLFGWVLAFFSNKLKNKSIITVILALTFFIAYYYFYSRAASIIENIIANGEVVADTFRKKFYPVFMIGSAGSGSAFDMLVLVFATAAVTCIVYFVLSKSFIKIATKKDTASKVVYREAPVKVSGVNTAIFNKELRRLYSSATYMLNCALGTFLMPVIAVMAIVFRARIQNVITLIPVSKEMVDLMVLPVVCMAVAMNDITAPSVSLEGKNIWIMQTMPVESAQVLDAKQKLHYVFTMPPAVLLAVCIAFVINMDFKIAALTIAVVLVYIMFSSALGLFLNLKRPNLNWTNESIPVKQSMSVMVSLLGSMLLAGLFGVGGYFALEYISATSYLLILLFAFVVIVRIINGWIKKEGAMIYGRL